MNSCVTHVSKYHTGEYMNSCVTHVSKYHICAIENCPCLGLEGRTVVIIYYLKVKCSLSYKPDYSLHTLARAVDNKFLVTMKYHRDKGPHTLPEPRKYLDGKER